MQKKTITFYPERNMLFVSYIKQQKVRYLIILDLKQVVLFHYENWAIYYLHVISPWIAEIWRRVLALFVALGEYLVFKLVSPSRLDVSTKHRPQKSTLQTKSQNIDPRKVLCRPNHKTQTLEQYFLDQITKHRPQNGTLQTKSQNIASRIVLCRPNHKIQPLQNSTLQTKSRNIAPRIVLCRPNHKTQTLEQYFIDQITKLLDPRFSKTIVILKSRF